jgi:DNA repair protein RecN (Recombination protein N)
MLRELRIKNFAVIDEAALEWGAGLNVLTGETGAGKSIILNALALICGERGASDIIRHREDEASVEALFDDLSPSLQLKLQEAGFGNNGELVIKRILSRSGKNRIYLNGSLCPLGLLAEVGSSVVHVYGQHEHHMLLHPERHLALLDDFAALDEKIEMMRRRFDALTAAWNNLMETRASLANRRKDRALLEAQAEEIARARLRPGEEEELQAAKRVLAHAEKLHQGSREGEELLYEGQDALVSRLAKYVSKLKDLAGIDEGLRPTVDLLESSLVQLQEAAAELRRYADRIHVEPGALQRLEDRLAEIHRLKRKYDGSVAEILTFHSEVDEALQSLDRGEDEISGLEKTFEQARGAAWDTAETLSLERQRIGKRFKKEIEKEVRSLGMPETTFEVRFITQDEKQDQPPFFIGGKRLTERGMDQLEFYFSPNPGEPVKPLAKVASGGELSRLMLAIKSMVLTPADIPTLLFDEVDAGIGGAVAEIVGKRLKQVAASHQVLCVTHLPQIAALADSHHVVQKEIAEGRTFTQVRRLDDKERVEEVARMLGGVKITDRTRRHAEEMVRGK